MKLKQGGFRRILEGVRQPAVVADGAFCVIYLNAAAESALGVERGAVLGRPIGEVVPGEWGGEEPVVAEGWRVERLGEGWVAYGPVEEGGVAEHLVSRMVEAEQLAAVGQLAASVAHEIGAPLTAISVAVEYLLKRECGACRFASRDLEVILTQTRRIAQLSRRLVDLARPGEPTRQAIDLNAVIRDGFDLVEKQLRSAGIEGKLELDPSLPMIQADPHQVQQVLINLLLNAQRAMADGGGRLEVRTRRRGGWVVLEVADTGPGIAAEDVSRIFLPFFSRSGGTGLGLPLARQIVHKHGGTIEVVTGPSGGATFTVQLPVGGNG